MSAQVTITQLPSAGPITGSESVPVVQNGVTVQTTTGAIAASPSQPYTYLTVVQTPQLANSRYFGATNGLTLSDGGAQGLFNITTTGALLSLVGSGAGFQVKTSSTDIVARSIVSSGAGLLITNGDAVSGNPNITLDGQVASLANLSANGLLAITTAGSLSATQIAGVPDQTVVTDGDAVAGSPTVGLANDPIIPGVGAILIPSGTTAERPVGVDGKIRYNSDEQTYEGYAFGAWREFALTGTVFQINTGTGLTGGPITSVGTISIANTAVVAGSYGSATQVGTFTVNEQGQLTAAANVTITPGGIGAVETVAGTANEITATGTTNVILSLPSSLTFTSKTVTGGTFNMTAATVGSDTVTTNTAAQTLTNKSISGATNTLSNIGNSSLTNSAITINGSSVSLGDSVTVTATATNALTIGTGLSGTSYNGSSAVTIAIDSSVVTLNGTQTLTNKTLTLPVISQISNTGVVSLPTATDTLVGRATTDTLTNKSISGSTNTLTNIANASLTNSSLTIGTTSIALGATSLTLGGLTSVAVTQDPVSALQLTTKQYVDALIASGIHFHQPVRVESPIALTATYNNGASGVGATLTNAGTQATLVIDGVTLSVSDRVLIYQQANQTQNGIYVVTSVGSGSTNWVLTRSSDADTYIINSANGLSEGATVFVQQGTTGAGETYTCNTSGVITFGTTNITFAQISSAQIYSAGTGLTLTGTQFSITNTAVTANTYGSASAVPVFAVNAQGQITGVTNTNIAVAASQVTSGTLAVAQGGTNIASYTIGDTLFASGATTLSKLALGTQGQVLTAGAAGPVWSGISGGTF
jgi:hypothetical protein